MAIADKIKERRMELKLSQADVARDIETDSARYCRWESGITIPSIQSMLKLSKALKVPIDLLLDKETDDAAEPQLVDATGADQKADTRHLYKTPNGKLLCNVEHCEWRICGVCPGAGCMKERAKV